MGINISKVQKVKLERRLVISVIDIFEKFFLHVVWYVPLIQPDEDRRGLFKKLDHIVKSTYHFKQNSSNLKASARACFLP